MKYRQITIRINNRRAKELMRQVDWYTRQQTGISVCGLVENGGSFIVISSLCETVCGLPSSERTDRTARLKYADWLSLLKETKQLGMRTV